MKKEQVEKLWQMIYNVFEQRLGAHHTSASYASNKTQANEIQFRLMQNIALLKGNSTEQVLQDVRADLNLMVSIGLMSEVELDSAEKILEEA